MTDSARTATAAVEVMLLRAIHDPGRFVERELRADGLEDEIHEWQAKAALAALTANPSLLFDCAVEVGGGEQVGWRWEADGESSCGPWGVLPYFSGEAGHADHEPVFRRVEGERA